MRFCQCYIKIDFFSAHRLVDHDFSYPHLVYTNEGEIQGSHPGDSCFSDVGKTGAHEQYIVLGSEDCFTMVRILRQTLHALGITIKSQF